MVSLVSTPVLVKKKPTLSCNNYEDDENDISSVQLPSTNVEAFCQNVDVETADDSQPRTTEDSLAVNIVAIKLQESTDDVVGETVQELLQDDDSKDADGVAGCTGPGPQNGCLQTNSEALKFIKCGPVLAMVTTQNTILTSDNDDSDDTDVGVQLKSSDNEERCRNNAVETENENHAEDSLANSLEALELKSSDSEEQRRTDAVENENEDHAKEDERISRGPTNGKPTSQQDGNQSKKYMRSSHATADCASMQLPSNGMGITGAPSFNASQPLPTGLGYGWSQSDHPPNLDGGLMMNYYPARTQYMNHIPGSNAWNGCGMPGRQSVMCPPVHRPIPNQYQPPVHNLSEQFFSTVGDAEFGRIIPSMTVGPPKLRASQLPTNMAPDKLPELSTEDLSHILGEYSCFDPSTAGMSNIGVYTDAGPAPTVQMSLPMPPNPPMQYQYNPAPPFEWVDSPPSHEHVVAGSPYRTSLQISPAASDTSMYESSVSSVGQWSSAAAASSFGDCDVTVAELMVNSGSPALTTDGVESSADNSLRNISPTSIDLGVDESIPTSDLYEYIRDMNESIASVNEEPSVIVTSSLGGKL